MKTTTLIFMTILFQNLFALSGAELAALVDNRDSPKDMKSNMSMVLTNKNGKMRNSEIRSYSKDSNKKHRGHSGNNSFWCYPIKNGVFFCQFFKRRTYPLPLTL